MRVLAQTEHKVKLDIINQKLLYLLSINARFSYSTLAKQVKLSREAVKQRIQRLQEKQVILGFQALIDSQKLGWSSYHLFAQLNNPCQEVEEKFTRQLIADNSVNALIQYHGQFDFEASYLLKDLTELKDKIQELSGLRHYEIFFVLKSIISKTYPKCMFNFSFPEFKVSKEGSFHNDFKQYKEQPKAFKPAGQSKLALDAINLELLKYLGAEAKLSAMYLSSKLKLSVDAVIYRIKKLIAAGIIKEFRPIINYGALGYSVYCVFFRFKNMTPEKEAKFKQFVTQHKNFLWSVSCLGPFNNLSYLIIKDTLEFHQVIKEIREEFHEVLDAYESMLSFAEYKYSYFPKGILKR